MTAGLKATASKLREAEAELIIAAQRLWQHRSETIANEKALAELEDELQAYYASSALDGGTDLSPPDFADLEAFRAKVSVAAGVAEKLGERLARADEGVRLAKLERNKLIKDVLVEEAVQPARAELDLAFEQLRAAAGKLIAAHQLAYRKFDDKAPAASSNNDYFGPAAEWLGSLPGTQWSTYPYSIRPSWLPQSVTWWPDTMPGVKEETELLLSHIATLENAA